jgi:hypothetical protein
MSPSRTLLPALAAAFTAAVTTPLATASFAADNTASYAVDTEVRLTTDQRTRGISDSLTKPAARLGIQAAHESGLVAIAECASVSKKQFLDGNGLGVTLAGGYRFGDPDAWHFGVGLATEMFPDAKFEAPHGFDMATGELTDFRRTNYNSSFAVLEVGYGALEGRILHVVSKTYRGADTGGVCGTMLALMPDPTEALACYGRGDHGSRGSWLLDLNYTFNVAPATTLTLHGGYQRIAHFEEANFADLRIGITHKRWGFEWNADVVATDTKVRELYLAQDGDKLRATDGNKLVLSLARKF